VDLKGTALGTQEIAWNIRAGMVYVKRSHSHHVAGMAYVKKEKDALVLIAPVKKVKFAVKMNANSQNAAWMLNAMMGISAQRTTA